jgi:hypothetical protein
MPSKVAFNRGYIRNLLASKSVSFPALFRNTHRGLLFGKLEYRYLRSSEVLRAELLLLEVEASDPNRQEENFNQQLQLHYITVLLGSAWWRTYILLELEDGFQSSNCQT